MRQKFGGGGVGPAAAAAAAAFVASRYWHRVDIDWKMNKERLVTFF